MAVRPMIFLALFLAACTTTQQAAPPPVDLSACLEAANSGTQPTAEQCKCLLLVSAAELADAMMEPPRPHQHGDAQDRLQDADYRALAFSDAERAQARCRGQR